MFRTATVQAAFDAMKAAQAAWQAAPSDASYEAFAEARDAFKKAYWENPR